MKKILILTFLLIFLFALNFSLSVFADIYPQNLFDDEKVFDAGEYEKLNLLLVETGAEAGFTVALVVTDNIGKDKSDADVVEYADLYYEKYFGINTDGIIFIINNDTLYDYISTSGICISYFTDERINRIHEKIKPYLKDGDYAGTVEKYCEQVLYYFNLGIPSNQHNVYEGDTDYYGDSYSNSNYNYEQKGEYTFEEKILIGTAGGFIVSVIIIILIIVSVKNRYGIKRARNAVDYLNRASIRFTRKSDTFIRRYVNKRKIETDNHNGTGGGASSVHRSSGGGMHGGGGSRR